MNVHVQSLVLAFVLCCEISDVWSLYPLCTPRDDSWEHVGSYAHGVAVSSCQNTCRASRSVTFSIIRRNGQHAGKAECYCISTPPETSVGGCSYRCDGQECGGVDGKHSVYPVCAEGTYGDSCGRNCPGVCADGVCDLITGDCPAGCADGRHGAACDQFCGQCANGVCGQHDAVCEGGCLDGWFTPTCTSECSENCLSAACNIQNATCSHGCEVGYYSANCTAICPDNCAHQQCNRDSGDCGDGCEDGWYTDKCADRCSDTCGGASQKCVQFNGTCIEGCIDGWYGPQCSQRCSEYCAGVLCHQYNGTCVVGCIEGWYTPQCTERCSTLCNATSCGLHDGFCSYGCTSGYYGSKCEDPCSTQCSEAGCRRDSGYCYSCYPGYHDTLCNGTCSQNCASGVCNRTDGACTEGCQCGWSGAYCDTGASCGGLSTGAIIGICVSLVVVITGVILFIVFFVCRKKKTNKAGTANQGFDNSLDYVNVGDPALRGPELPMTLPLSAIPLTSKHTVNIDSFQEYIRAIQESKQNMYKEYEDLPGDDVHGWNEACRPGLRAKNKFKGIYPYDDNRVVLQDVTLDDPTSDYINASRIQGYRPGDKFIASLGPRVRTLDDFWRMIWQEKVSTIVMLTNLVEAGIEKCVRYWPEGKSEQYGALTVVGDLEDSWPSYVIRRFIVHKGANSRTVTQYHFTQWPDHGVPSDAISLLEFRRKAFHLKQHAAPIVIHCSAGVGRTGTLIALDYLIKQAEVENKVDVFNCVYQLRHQRMHMVQTVEQYVFLHEALTEYFRVGNTTKAVSDFKEHYNELFADENEGAIFAQYQALEHLAPKVPGYDKESALSPPNNDKNRYPNVIPMMSSRVFLRSRVRGRNDYINAVCVNGYKTKNAYHVTQFPLENTVIDFWRMVQDYETRMVVVLVKKHQAKEMNHFLPAKNRPMDVLDNVASVRSSMTTGSYRVIDLNLAERSNDDNQYMNMEEVSKQMVVDVRVYEITVPPDQECLDYTTILEVFNDLRGRRDDKPIAVLCLNGATYSGQFVACCNLFEMIESEQEIDVFQVSKYIRDSRPEFIGSLEQYRGLYDAANMTVAQHGIYANC